MDVVAKLYKEASKLKNSRSHKLHIRPSWILQERLSSLSSKFPLIPGSENSLEFCTTLLGHKLQQKPLDADFDLSDIHDPPTPAYSVLHDPHLLDYFQNPVLKKRLLDKGFVTEEGFVRCSLMEFNAYRQWVRKLKLDALQQQRRWSKVEEEKRRQERIAQVELERDKELYSIIREREEKAREAREKARRRKQIEQKKYMKKIETDAKRRVRFKEDQRLKKEYEEIKRNRILEKITIERANEEKKKLKIRIRLAKRNDDCNKQRMSQLQERKSAQKKEKLLKMQNRWLDRCEQTLEHMQEHQKQEEKCREEHLRNIERRNSRALAQRRKSLVLFQKNAQARREEKEKLLRESEGFLEKMRTKKEKQLVQWKVKHNVLRRATLNLGLELLRDVRKGSQPKYMFEPTRKTKYMMRHARRSTWNIEQSLLGDFGDRVDLQGREEKLPICRLKAIEDLEEDELAERLEHALRLQELFDPDSVLRVDVRLLVENVIASAYDVVFEGEAVTVPELASHKEETEVLQGLVSAPREEALETIQVFVDQPFETEEGESKRDLDVIQTAQCLVANAASAAKDYMSKSYKYILHPIETSLEAVAKEIVDGSVSWVKKNFHYYSSCAPVTQTATEGVASEDLIERALVKIQESLETAQVAPWVSEAGWSNEEEICRVAKELAENAILVVQKSSTQMKVVESGLEVNVMKSSEALPMRISLFYEQEDEEDVSDISESELSLSPVRTLSIVGNYEQELQESAKDVVEDVILSAKNSLERLQNNVEMALAARARELASEAIVNAQNFLEQPQEETPEKELESFHVAFTARSLASQAIITAQNWLEQVRIESEMQRAKEEDLERRQKLKLEKEQKRIAREIAARAVVDAKNALMQEELDQYLEQMRKKKKKEKALLRGVSKTQDRAARELASHAILAACKSLDKAKIKRETENDVEQHVKQIGGKKLEKQFIGDKSSSKLDPRLRESKKTKGTETSDPRRTVKIKEKAKQRTKQAAWAEKEICQLSLVSAKFSSDRFELEAEMKKLQQQTTSQQQDIRAKEVIDHEIELAHSLEKVKLEDSLSKTSCKTSEEEIVNQKDIHEICVKEIVQEAIVSAQVSVERAELKDLLSKTPCQFDKEEVSNEAERNLLEKTSKHAGLIIENAFVVLESTDQEKIKLEDSLSKTGLETSEEKIVNQKDIHEICVKEIVQEAIVSAQVSVERAELRDLLSKTPCQFDKGEVSNEAERNLLEKTSKHAGLIIENAFTVLESTDQVLKTDGAELVNEDEYVVLTHEEAMQANLFYDNLRKEAICKEGLKNVEDFKDTLEISSFCDDIVNNNYLPELILTEDEKKEVEIYYRRIAQDLLEEEDEDSSKTERKTLECQDISTKVSRYVANVISSVLSTLKQDIPNTYSDVNAAQVSSEDVHKRRSSVHFSEPANVHNRRDSTYRPPTPRFLKWNKSGVDEELWEEEDELGSEDMDSEKEESTLPARYEIPQDKNSDVFTRSLEQLKDADDVKTMNKDLGNQKLKKLSPRTASPVVDEQCGECVISPEPSNVILPRLRSSEQALVTDTDITENRFSQESPVSPRLSPTTRLPALPLSSSVVTAEAGVVRHDKGNGNAHKSSSNASLPTLSPSRTSLVVSEQVQFSVTTKNSDSLNKEEILDRLIKTSEKSVEMLKDSPSYENLKTYSKESQEVRKVSPKSSIEKTVESNGKKTSKSSSSEALRALPATSDDTLKTSPDVYEEFREVVKVSPKTSGELTKASPKASRGAMKASPKTSGDSLTKSSKESREVVKVPPKTSGELLKTSRKTSREVMKASPKTSGDSLIKSSKESREAVKVSPKTSGELLKTSPKASCEVMKAPPTTSDDSLKPSPKASREDVKVSPKTSSEVPKISPKASREGMKASPKTSGDSLTKSSKESHKVVKASPKTSGELLKTSPQASREVIKASPKKSDNSLKRSSKASLKDVKVSPKASDELLKTSPKASREVMKVSPKTSGDSVTKSSKESHKVVKASPKTSGELLKTSPQASREVIKASPKKSDNSLKRSSKASLKDLKVSPKASGELLKTSPKASREVMKVSSKATADSLKTSPKDSFAVVKDSSKTSDALLKTSPKGSREVVKVSLKTSGESLKTPKGPREVKRVFPKTSGESLKTSAKASPKTSGNTLKTSPKESREVVRVSPKTSGDYLKLYPKASREIMKASSKASGDSLKTSPKESCDVMEVSFKTSGESLKTSGKVMNASPKTSGESLKISPKESREASKSHAKKLPKKNSLEVSKVSLKTSSESVTVTKTTKSDMGIKHQTSEKHTHRNAKVSPKTSVECASKAESSLKASNTSVDESLKSQVFASCESMKVSSKPLHEFKKSLKATKQDDLKMKDETCPAIENIASKDESLLATEKDSSNDYIVSKIMMEGSGQGPGSKPLMTSLDSGKDYASLSSSTQEINSLKQSLSSTSAKVCTSFTPSNAENISNTGISDLKVIGKPLSPKISRLDNTTNDDANKDCGDNHLECETNSYPLEITGAKIGLESRKSSPENLESPKISNMIGSAPLSRTLPTQSIMDTVAKLLVEVDQTQSMPSTFVHDLQHESSKSGDTSPKLSSPNSPSSRSRRSSLHSMSRKISPTFLLKDSKSGKLVSQTQRISPSDSFSQSKALGKTQDKSLQQHSLHQTFSDRASEDLPLASSKQATSIMPSPPLVPKSSKPSPRSSRSRLTHSRESFDLRKTQSETSIGSSKSSKEENSLSPRISEAWLPTKFSVRSLPCTVPRTQAQNVNLTQRPQSASSLLGKSKAREDPVVRISPDFAALLRSKSRMRIPSLSCLPMKAKALETPA